MLCQVPYVEPVLFLYMFCLFMMWPVEQQMVYKKVCLSHFNETYCDNIASNTTKADQDMIQEESAQWDLYISTCKTLPAVVSTIFFGALSDGVGRKRILMFPVLGESINAIVYFLNAWYFSAPIPFMLIGNVISGLFGNFATILMGVFAYIADVTTETSRSQRVTILDAMVFLGSVLSYLTSGLMLEKFGFLPVYGFLVCVYIVLLIYLCFLKESYHPPEEVNITSLFSKRKVLEFFQLITKKRNRYYRRTVFLLFMCFFILLFLFSGINGITVLYILHDPLNFPPSEIGYLFAEINALKFLGSLFISCVLIRRFKWTDYSIIFVTSLMYSGYNLSLGLARDDWQIYVVPVWCLGTSSGVAAARAGLSKLVSPEEQGKMFSVVASIEVISSLLAGTVFNSIYIETVHLTPSFTFYLMAGVSCIPLIFSVLLKFYGQPNSSYDEL